MTINAKLESPEVLYAADEVVTVSREQVDELVTASRTTPRERIRLCTHRDTADPVHEMLIVHAAGTYVRPHKHVDKAESFHVIEGRVDVVLFDEQGALKDVIRMGDYATGLPFYYRIDQPIFHTLLIRSGVLVFHETTSGPFRREQTVFASWAPEETSLEVAGFIASVDERAQTHLKQSL
jgi:cupin fold WbuC family metalloprotein